MSFRAKLLVILVGVVLVPMGVSAWMSLRVHQRAFDEQLDAAQRSSAQQGARLVRASVDASTKGLALLVGQVRWSELTPAELDGAVWLTYRQQEDLALVELVDGNGAVRGAAFAGSGGAAEPGHPSASDALRRGFPGALPARTARARGLPAIGEPIAGDDGAAILPIAIPAPGGQPGETWIAGVGLSLRGVCADLRSSVGTAREVLLVDDDGHSLCGTSGPKLALVDGNLPRTQAGDATWRDASGRELRAAIALLPSGWAVVVQQATAEAFASSRQLRTQSLLWMVLGGVLALLAGILLSRAITRPVRALVAGAHELERGNLAHRLDATRRDELGEVAHAFNAMSDKIEERDAEIRAWNQELQQRVDERTRALKDAQEQLLRSQKVAAIASLGAGFAHEINNPLTSVIGFAQLLSGRLKKREDALRELELLGNIESESLRIKRIIARLQLLTENFIGTDLVEIDANHLLDESLRPFAGELEKGKVEVVREYARDLPPLLGNAGELGEALGHVVRNALTAMQAGGGGKLLLTTNNVDGRAIKIAVADTGCGIASEHLDKIFDPFFTTKENWRSEGLGLSLALHVVSQHHGRIQAASAVGKGTTITIMLPASNKAAHLR